MSDQPGINGKPFTIDLNEDWWPDQNIRSMTLKEKIDLEYSKMFLTKEQVEEVSDYRETIVIKARSIYLLDDYIKKYYPEWKYHGMTGNMMTPKIVLVKR